MLDDMSGPVLVQEYDGVHMAQLRSRWTRMCSTSGPQVLAIDGKAEDVIAIVRDGGVPPDLRSLVGVSICNLNYRFTYRRVQMWPALAGSERLRNLLDYENILCRFEGQRSQAVVEIEKVRFRSCLHYLPPKK